MCETFKENPYDAKADIWSLGKWYMLMAVCGSAFVCVYSYINIT